MFHRLYNHTDSARTGLNTQTRTSQRIDNLNIKLHNSNTKYIKNKKFDANGVEAKSLKKEIIFEKYMK